MKIEKGKGQRLYKKAKQIIPGGTMLLSKRPEMFLPEKWPSYFSKAKGCKVWDLDNNEYIDMSIMGIGTNILGYANPHVDKAVNKCQKPWAWNNESGLHVSLSGTPVNHIAKALI